MYATCLFCNHDLGRNETLETFPVGKRLAFDADKGRLWVVCKKCERWNLSPLEERWEAIESAEKIYRDSRRRVSTDEIGLAKLRDGTELVRIGKPMRPEFAAWRYGDQFGRRRRRQMILVGGGVVAIGAVVAAGATAGVSIGGFGWLLGKLGTSLVQGSPEAIVAKIRTDDGSLLHVRRRHLSETALLHDPNGALAIDLRFKNGRREFRGREAERIAATVIPTVNRFGASKTAVADAVNAIETVGGTERFLEGLSRTAQGRSGGDVELVARRGRRALNARSKSEGLFAMPATDRLALEMALHEETERRALAGELADLERAWKDAEEIAGISDNLLLPDTLQTSMDELRRTTTDSPRRLIDRDE